MARNTDSNDMVGSAAPVAAFSNEDHFTIVIIVAIVSWLLSATTIAAKLSIHRKIGTQHIFDYVLFVGTLTLLVQTVLVIYPAHLGSGQRRDQLDTATIKKIRQVS